MEKITYPSNTVRQHVRNALSSKLFCAVAIVSAIFSASRALAFVTSMLYAGLTGRYEYAGGFIITVLAIIGTVGLFTVHSAAKSNDSLRLLSGIRMSKCYIAIKVLYVILLYVASFALIALGSMFAFCNLTLEDFTFHTNSRELLEEFFRELGIVGISVAAIGVALIIGGVFLLAIAILGTAYRKGISKAVKCAVRAETSDRTEIRISSFAVGFGYVVGVLIMLSSLSFTGTDLVMQSFAYDPDHRAYAIYLISFAVSKLAYLAFGFQIFLFSLFLSKTKLRLMKVVSGNTTGGSAESIHCHYCGAVIPVGSLFCNSCGGKVGSVDDAAKQDNPAQPEQPVCPDDAEKPRDVPEDKPEEPIPSEAESNAQPEAEGNRDAASDTVFCTSCGMPMPAKQPFCTNCGNKLH